MKRKAKQEPSRMTGADTVALRGAAQKAADDAKKRESMAAMAKTRYKAARKAWKAARKAAKRARKIARKARKAFEAAGGEKPAAKKTSQRKEARVTRIARVAKKVKAKPAPRQP